MPNRYSSRQTQVTQPRYLVKEGGGGGASGYNMVDLQSLKAASGIKFIMDVYCVFSLIKCIYENR